ncbi:MAG TPA: hypothetical protein VGN46_05475 [Luteibacter sp.]|uniref:hypothetical protein n=1 Tax=Luteibacter sp. TaxID=1886636 RepID=UPI002F3FE99D
MSRNNLPFAVVIEPKPLVADMVADTLRRMGYEVAVSATHAGGAHHAKTHGMVSLGVVAVPAPGEDLGGAYLLEARHANDKMGMLVLLSDPSEGSDEALPGAQKLVKPFGMDELKAAVILATS